MTKLSPHEWATASEIADAVRRGELRATELLDQSLALIGELNGVLNSFVHLDEAGARESARAVDAAVARGEDPGPLAGVPLAVKDLEDCRGMPTREGSLLFRDTAPASRDGVHLARLRAAGAIPVGKTAVPEFGLTAQTTTIGYGVTRNPWRLDATPGGSSGGSAAAVAAGMVPLATASDGGGSTRIPAAWTGLVGLKPSHGRIPVRRPTEQSVLGAVAVSVVDIARHLDVAAGPDGSDHQSLPSPTVRYEDAIETLDLSGLRAAFSLDLGYATVDDEVLASVDEAARMTMKSAGLKHVSGTVSLPNAVPAWILATADRILQRLRHLGHWPEHADLLDPVTRLALTVRERLGPEHLFRADERRRQAIHATAELFTDVDVLLTPATAVTAPPAVGPPRGVVGRAGLTGPVPFTQFVNFAWNPAIVVPVGLSSEGMPISLQIVGPRHVDEIPLRLARILEQERPWQRRPRVIETDFAGPVEPPSESGLPLELIVRLLEWNLDLSHDGASLPDELAAELAAQP